MSTAEKNRMFQINSNSTNGICGLCGRKDLKLVLVDSEEGLHYDLPNKIEIYIPIKPHEFKTIPVECCTACINTILSWHEFVLKVLEVNKNPLDSSNVKPSTVSDDGDSEKGTEDSFNIIYLEELEPSNQEISAPEEKSEYEVDSFPLTDCATSEKNSELDDVHSISTKNMETEAEDSSSPEFAENSAESKKPTKQRRKKKEVEENFICGTCNKGFTRKHDMQRHQIKKHGETDSCASWKRGEIKEIMEKYKIHHDGEVMYECDICQQKSRHSYNLFRHMSIHTGVKPYICHICGKSFRLDSSFRKHIKQFHEGVKNYKCEICGRRFGTKFSRDEHYNIHTDARPYSCGICQKAFKQKSTLRVHMMYHTGNFKFECSQCDKKFRRAQELSLHECLHSGQKPYMCEVCDHTFRRNQDLKRHMAVHSTNKMEWICAICERGFFQEKTLKFHLKVHLEGDLDEC